MRNNKTQMTGLPPGNNPEEILQQLSLLHKKYDSLKKWAVTTVTILVAAAAISLVSFTTLKPKVVTTWENNILKVKGIIVTDSNGVERVWMGSHGPDALVFGRRINREEGFSGILMLDKNGTERSGYGTFDSNNSVGITLDEADKMVANFTAQDAGGVKLTILDEYNNQIGLGTNHRGPYLKLLQRDSSGKNKILMLRADSTRGLNLVN